MKYVWWDLKSSFSDLEHWHIIKQHKLVMIISSVYVTQGVSCLKESAYILKH